jgi:hypothetical protein
MKLLGTLLILSLLSLGSGGYARDSSDEEQLASAVNDFLTIWLLRRDAEQAVNYISAKPVLGRCMTPDYLTSKEQLSRDDILGVFRKVFTRTLEKVPEAKALSELVDSSGAISSEDSNVIFARHSREQYFQIFKLRSVNDPSGIAYICKFDERSSFRKEVARPDVYYVIASVKGKDSCPAINFELLWVKESPGWRILTVAVLED